MKKVARFIGKCLICPWQSEENIGPVLAGRHVSKHVHEKHPKVEGWVALIEKITIKIKR